MPGFLDTKAGRVGLVAASDEAVEWPDEIVRRDLADERAATRARFDHTEQLEGPQRFPDGCARDLELLRQGPLGRQLVARSKLALLEERFDLLDDALVKPAAPDGLDDGQFGPPHGWSGGLTRTRKRLRRFARTVKGSFRGYYPAPVRALIFDLDGTLVDTVYGHVFAWQRALAEAGLPIDGWKVHRRIGMSGGLFVNALLRETGRPVTAEDATRLQRRHAEAYARQVSQVRALPGARELLAYLTEAGVPWAIATSGRLETARPALELLGVDGAAYGLD